MQEQKPAARARPHARTVDFRAAARTIPPRGRPGVREPMPRGPLDPKELGFYFELSQVGMEMVVPIVGGLALDYYLNWAPWGVVVGAVLGLVGGMAHLLAILNRQQQQERRQDGRP